MSNIDNVTVAVVLVALPEFRAVIRPSFLFHCIFYFLACITTWPSCGFSTVTTTTIKCALPECVGIAPSKIIMKITLLS